MAKKKRTRAKPKQLRKVKAVDEFRLALQSAVDEIGHSEVATRCGVGRPYLYRVLAGEQIPSLDWAARVARECGIEISFEKVAG